MRRCDTEPVPAYDASESGHRASFWVDKNGGAPTIVIFTAPEGDDRD
jgi:hypothetical protein